MHRLARVLRRTADRLDPRASSLGARHAIPSVIASADDLLPRPTTELLDVAVASIEHARDVDLEPLWERVPSDDEHILRTWPGEHYRLLAGAARAIGASQIVEIGTYQGVGTLALLAGAPNATITTFDVLPPTEIPGSLLLSPHPRINCEVGDLSDPPTFDRYGARLRAADLVFIDGPKDGDFEQRFLPMLIECMRGAAIPLIILDDIKTPNMLRLWRDLQVPKLDMTSFGHWSGTGFLLGRPA